MPLAESTQPPPEAVVVELEAILASTDFDASPRSRAFLRFVIEETIAGRQASLTQTAIATRVFDRREDFDATLDPIVRIQAGRLRRSLERYYLLAGAGDPVRIELPRGAYVPRFSWAKPNPGRRGAPAPPPVWSGEWPTLVVHPFEIAGSDPDLQEVADHFQEQLAMELGRYRDLRVVLPGEPERASSGGDKATFALSGRLHRHDGGAKLAAQLVDRRSSRQVWAQEYHGPGSARAFWADAACVVAARVASEQGVVAQGLWVEQRQKPPSEPTPYGAILRSYQFFFNRDPADFAPAAAALQRAVKEEPECALAWVQLSRLLSANYAFEVVPDKARIGEAVACAQTGVRLDPSSQRARAALAFAFFLKGELAASRRETEAALDLNPDSFVYLESLGWLLTLLGEWERGPALVRGAVARNPYFMPLAHHALWLDHLRRGEFDLAHQAALDFRDAAFFWRALTRACCLGHLGRRAEGEAEVAELLRSKPDFGTRGRTLIGRLIKSPDLFERVVEGLRKAGLTLS